jgi:hypothetical protein
MNEIRLKKTKISFALTPLLSTDGKAEFDTIDQWSSRFARITVAGDIPPPTTFGIQWVKRPTKFTFRELVGAHLSFIPGAGACLVAKPTFRVGQGIADLAAFIDLNKIDMAFGCKICDKEGNPRGFVVSNSVIEHIMGGFNNRILASDPWEAELDSWLTNALRHRYIDATKFEILIENTPSPPPSPEPEFKPRGRPKKTK